jgi:hypothetical protein
MPRQKRPFYLIGHNPNTIQEAEEFLVKGANALEPDIVRADGKFYVSHLPQASYDEIPTVEQYLTALKELIVERRFNLALLIWDMKDKDFEPNDLMDVIRRNFSGGPCDGVAMLMTHSDDHEFVSRYSGAHANVGVGVDESDVPAELLERMYRKRGQKNFSYADGITTVLNKPGVFKKVTEAQRQRDENEPDSFKLIYTWVLSKEASMRRYLNTYIDGIMVDAGAVERLKELIATAPYNACYELAQNGYNPFSASSLPRYTLKVKTQDKFLAGTDSSFQFTLKGKSGESITGLPFHSNEGQAFERGTTTRLTLEGTDLGEIESLTVEALTVGMASAWLPEKISVESKLLSKPCVFDFNSSGGEEWVTKKRGPVTKLPS